MRKITLHLLIVLLFIGTSKTQADLIYNDGGPHTIDFDVTDILRVYDGPGPSTTTINFQTGGLIASPYSLNAYESSLINVYDGSISTLVGDGDSITNIYGGTITVSLINTGDSTINIYGGTIPAAIFFENSVINIYGDGFNYPLGPITHMDWDGTITGTLHMGDSLSLDFTRCGDYTDIILHEMEIVPVPGALLLSIVGLGIAGVKLRKHA